MNRDLPENVRAGLAAVNAAFGFLRPKRKARVRLCWGCNGVIDNRTARKGDHAYHRDCRAKMEHAEK